MRQKRLALVLLLPVCCALPLSPALASDGEHALSVSMGYGTYLVPDYSPDGAILGLSYRRGFSDAFCFRVSGGGGLYYGADQLTYSGHMTVGVTYLLDVLKYVPYVEVGAGAIVIAGGDAGRDLSPLVQVGVGLDILRSRTFSYGIKLEFESLLQETSFFHAGVRATWRWGYF
jgi:hypothetical protein